MTIKPRTKWVYVGADERGHGLIHQIGHVSGNTINTWSDPEFEPEKEGYMWRGSKDRFLIEFKPYIQG